MERQLKDRARLAVVGIGNTLAGDDGVGVVVADRLRDRWSDADRVLVVTLSGDLFAVADLLDQADEFLFIDAIAGDCPGQLRVLTSATRAFALSLHQTDIGSVMTALKSLAVTDPFPDWQVWGITIAPPQTLGEGLSREVAAAATELERRLVAHVEGAIGR